MKIKVKKFGLSPKQVAAMESFIDSLGSRLITDEFDSKSDKIIVKYYE